jgi:hypothetical protein
LGAIRFSDERPFCFRRKTLGHKQTQQNTVAYSTPPPTAATTQLQSMVNQGPDYQTPIRNAYGRAQQQLTNSYQSPLGAYTTADVRDKSLRSQNRDLQQSEGLDLSSAAQENAQGQFSRQATVAGLTAPQLYNSGSTTTQPFGVADALGLGFGLGGSVLQ